MYTVRYTDSPQYSDAEWANKITKIGTAVNAMRQGNLLFWACMP